MIISKAPYVISSIYTGVMLGLFPLWTGFANYSSITGAKYRFFFLAGIIYLLLMVFALVLKAAKGKLREDAPPGIDCVFFISFLLWAAVSCLLSDYDALRGEGRREGLVTLALYIAPYVFLSVYAKLRLWHLYCLGAAVLINCVIGFLQLLGNNPLGLFPAGLVYHDAGIMYAGSFMGTLGNADILSAFLSLALPLLMGGCAEFRHKKLSLILLLPLGTGCALMVYSGVSAGSVALLAACVFILPFVMGRRSPRMHWALPMAVAALCSALAYLFPFNGPQVRFSPSLPGFVLVLAAVFFLICALKLPEFNLSFKKAVFFFVLVVLLAIAALYFIPFSSGPAAEAHQILHGNIDPSFGSSRIRIWKRAVEMINERPLFGSGPDTFIKRVGFVFSRFIEQTGQLRQQQIDCAHNEFLNIAANCGIGALAFYVLALAALMIKAIKASRSKSVMTLMAAFFAYIVQLFFTFSICSVSPLFYLTAALLSRHSKGGVAKCNTP